LTLVGNFTVDLHVLRLLKHAHAKNAQVKCISCVGMKLSLGFVLAFQTQMIMPETRHKLSGQVRWYACFLQAWQDAHCGSLRLSSIITLL